MSKFQAVFLHSVTVCLMFLLVTLTHSAPVNDSELNIQLLLETFTEANNLKDSCQKFIDKANLSEREENATKLKKYQIPAILSDAFTNNNSLTILHYVNYNVKKLLSQNEKLVKDGSEVVIDTLIPFVKNITRRMRTVEFKVTKIINILKQRLNQKEQISNDEMEQMGNNKLTEVVSTLNANFNLPDRNTRTNTRIEVVIARDMKNVMNKFTEAFKAETIRFN